MASFLTFKCQMSDMKTPLFAQTTNASNWKVIKGGEAEATLNFNQFKSIFWAVKVFIYSKVTVVDIGIEQVLNDKNR